MTAEKTDVIKDINTAWTKDSKINRLDLEAMAALGQELHAKYLVWLTEARKSLPTVEAEFQRARKFRKRYYNSELTKKELEASDLLPYNKNKPLKSEMDELLEGDEVMIEIKTRLDHLKTVKAQVEEILRAIHDRTFSIKDTVRMRTFEHGE